MLHAYLQLHLFGYAHSVEVWQQGQLVGGMYGLAQGALFYGESMFSHISNASKCALMAFCRHFAAYGGELIDCQVLNAHTAQLGAREIPRYSIPIFTEAQRPSAQAVRAGMLATASRIPPQ